MGSGGRGAGYRREVRVQNRRLDLLDVQILHILHDLLDADLVRVDIIRPEASHVFLRGRISAIQGVSRIRQQPPPLGLGHLEALAATTLRPGPGRQLGQPLLDLLAGERSTDAKGALAGGGGLDAGLELAGGTGEGVEGGSGREVGEDVVGQAVARGRARGRAGGGTRVPPRGELGEGGWIHGGEEDGGWGIGEDLGASLHGGRGVVVRRREEGSRRGRWIFGGLSHGRLNRLEPGSCSMAGLSRRCRRGDRHGGRECESGEGSGGE